MRSRAPEIVVPFASSACAANDRTLIGVNLLNVAELRKLDAYLKRVFANPRVRVVPRPKKDDSAEVYIGDEFIGVLSVDDEDDERSYHFQMAILDTDLED